MFREYPNPTARSAPLADGHCGKFDSDPICRVNCIQVDFVKLRLLVITYRGPLLFNTKDLPSEIIPHSVPIPPPATVDHTAESNSSSNDS